MTSLIEDGLRRVVDSRPVDTGKSSAFELPTSSWRGELQPGIDLTDMSTIYDVEDGATARRIFGDVE